MARERRVGAFESWKPRMKKPTNTTPDVGVESAVTIDIQGRKKCAQVSRGFS